MRHYALFLVSAAVLAAAGCQKSHANSITTVEVKGIVTLDGRPLEGAEVVFTTPLMATFTAVTGADGGYQLSTNNGGAYHCTGPCRVTVSKFVMPPGQTAEPNLSPQLQGAQQLVPLRYCDPAQSMLMVDVPEQGGQFDLPLTSQ